MEVHKEINNALRKVLEQRTGPGLPSNFNYRMLQQVRMEAERQRKRRKITVAAFFVLAVGALIAMAAYALFWYLDIDLLAHLPRLDIKKPDTGVVEFYTYIAFLVLLLLGVDYGIRNHKRKVS